MTHTDREALLKLWEDVSETRPKNIRAIDGVFIYDSPSGPLRVDDIAIIAALARDALHNYYGKMVNESPPSLEQLIAAARAVAGKEKTDGA